MATLHYSDTLERLLKQQGEHALALARAHEDAQRWTANWSTRLQLPTIVLSTVTGFFSATTDMIPQIALGAISISVAIISSVQSYLSFAKRSEAHRATSLNYSRIHRLLHTELSLVRSERTPANKLLELLRTETETLSETAPILPQAVKDLFKKNFSSSGGCALPPSLNGLDPIHIAPESGVTPTPKVALQAPTGIKIGFEV